MQVLARWIPRCGPDWLIPGVRLRCPWTGGLPGSKPTDQVKAAGRRVGIEGLTISAFRKTVGTLAKGWGLGPLELKAILRHTSVKTQAWYDEADVDELRPAIAKIRYG